MTIHNDTPNASDAYATTAAVQSGAIPGATAQPQASGQQAWGFFTSGNLGGVSRNATSEVLTKAQLAITTYYKEKLGIERGYEVAVLPVDNSKETALYLSGLIVAVRRTNDKSAGVGFHTLLLEGSNEPMTPVVQTWNNQPVAVDRVAGDVMDAKYAQVVQDIVQRAFPEVQCRANSAQVVPRSFNWEDADLVRRLAVNAIYPCVTDLEAHTPGFSDINLANWSRDAGLQANINFNEADRVDHVGLPQRSNLTITLTAVDNSKANQQAINAQERTKRVCTVAGFIDLLWAPSQPAGHAYGVVQQGPRYTYAPRVVMTVLENEMRMTPASELFALVSALPLRENNNWFPYYAPRQLGAGNKIDLRDVGALNFEANVLGEPGNYGGRIETKLASFTNVDLGRLLTTAFHPELTYSLDVSECGADTWYNEIFAAAAAGSGPAAMAILDAANELTGGAFGRHYNSSESPVVLNEDRVHLGYYIGGDGQKHDIREIDYLAVLNLQGDNDPGAAQAWSDTFLRTEYPLIKRLAERKKMIAELVRGDVTFTGFARRVTYNARFLAALAAGARDCGLDIKVTSPSFGGDYSSQRGVAGFLAQSGFAPGQSGLFNTGYTAAPTAGGMGRGFLGTRWG